MPIKQIFFDCDNTLVLSEDVAFEATADLVNNILGQYNISKVYTSDMIIEYFVGEKFKGILKGLMATHNLDIPADLFELYCKTEELAVVDKLKLKVKECIGATQVLAQLHVEKKYNLAVVSSSAGPRIQAAIEKVGQSQFFDPAHIFSASTSLPKPTPKPDPAVYQFAMEKMGVKAAECIAVEDSRSGATSACRAGIRTIAYVGSYNGEKKQKEIGDLLTKSGCVRVMYWWSEFPAILAELEEV